MKPHGLSILLLVGVAACATPGTTHYYTLLGESPPPATAATAQSGYRVAIGPATVPEALDRPQLVLRVAPNRYAITDVERWSEPLKIEIPRVLAEQVGARLPAARVATDAQNGGQDADYRVLIDVLRFESVSGEAVLLEVTWSLRGRAGVRLHEANSVLTEKVGARGIAPLVSAHARALAALGGEIAAALEAARRARP